MEQAKRPDQSKNQPVITRHNKNNDTANQDRNTDRRREGKRLAQKPPPLIFGRGRSLTPGGIPGHSSRPDQENHEQHRAPDHLPQIPRAALS